MTHDSNRREFLKLSTTVGTGLALCGTSTLARATGDTPTETEMSLFQAIRKRRSVRKFQSTPIPKEHLDEILKAASRAPTSGNQQPWNFLVIDDSAKILELKQNCVNHRLASYQAREDPTPDQLAAAHEAVENNLANYFSAPVYVVVLTSAKSKYPDYNHWDGPLAAANLMLAARALGYGTVFITDSIPDEVTKQTFNIPDHLTRVCITPIGIPDEWPRSPSKKPWRSFVVKNSF